MNLKNITQNIIYLGKTNDIKNLLKNDAMILPCIERVCLNQSLKHHQCMPIITTNVPGCNDIVIDGYNGFLVKPYSSKSLVDADQNY